LFFQFISQVFISQLSHTPWKKRKEKFGWFKRRKEKDLNFIFKFTGHQFWTIATHNLCAAPVSLKMELRFAVVVVFFIFAAFCIHTSHSQGKNL
jgi:hypothetical protein